MPPRVYGDVPFALVGEGDVGLVMLGVVFGVVGEDVGGLGSLDGTADVLGRAVLGRAVLGRAVLGRAVLGRAVLVGEVGVAEVAEVAEVEAAVEAREPVVGVRLGRGAVPVGGECCGR